MYWGKRELFQFHQTINTSLNMNVQGCKIVAKDQKGIIFLKLFNIHVIKLFFIEIYRELKKTIKDTNL